MAAVMVLLKLAVVTVGGGDSWSRRWYWPTKMKIMTAVAGALKERPSVAFTAPLFCF
jgi:hypothetical protein